VRRSKKKTEQATADDAQALSGAGARAGGAVNLGQLEGEAAIGGGIERSAEEKAHRWI
jgi:hypothetical protein